MSSSLFNFFETLLDLFYPRFCFSCQDKIKDRGAVYLCAKCISSVDTIGEHVCPVCGRHGSIDICPSCWEERPPYKMARAAGFYEGILKEGIHRLKYNGHVHFVPTLARFLIHAFKKEKEWRGEIDLVIPVPMDRRRERERGFNQSRLLAKYFSKNLSFPCKGDILRKVKKTLPQVNLTREKRLVNLAGAFYLNPGESLSGKGILLIDDVYTTGATVTECSNTLLRGGARDVNVLTLARGA
ncbi:MAG: ComF family protein [Candidatus Omnitrophica bacterium]|nr:ComF family protein [Candidatus Omnitrophota bacterium]